MMPRDRTARLYITEKRGRSEKERDIKAREQEWGQEDDIIKEGREKKKRGKRGEDRREEEMRGEERREER